jgi:hypothetical protein
MATRSWSPETKALLVQLLNDNNTEAQEAHDSPIGQELLVGQRILPFDNSILDQLTLQLARKVEIEKLLLETRPSRTVRSHERYTDTALKDSIYQNYGLSAEDPNEPSLGSSVESDSGSDWTQGDPQHECSDDDDQEDHEEDYDGLEYLDSSVVAKLRKDFRKQDASVQEAFSQDELNCDSF